MLANVGHLTRQMPSSNHLTIEKIETIIIFWWCDMGDRIRFLLVFVLFFLGTGVRANADPFDLARRIYLEAHGNEMPPFLLNEPNMLEHRLPYWLYLHAQKSINFFPKNVEQLQQLARELREDRQSLPNGEMLATTYQEAIRSVTDNFLILADGRMRFFVSELERWRTQQNSLPTPYLVNASFALGRSGPELQEALTNINAPPLAKIDRQMFEKARRFLLKHKSVASKDPYWFNLMVELAIYLRLEEHEFKQLVEEGLRAFPENTALPVIASSYYLSKWQGDVGKLAGFARWVSELPTAKTRKDFYARIYWHALRTQYKLRLFKVADKDWQIMRPSLIAWSQSFPTKETKNNAALLACLGGDRKLTKSFLTAPKFRAELPWLHDGDLYVACVQWASS